jgi:hypothetical protein
VVTELSLTKANESYIGYNPSAVTGRKANGLYSTDKNTTVKPVAFWSYCWIKFSII